MKSRNARIGALMGQLRHLWTSLTKQVSLLPMQILISNDDGIHAPGLNILAESLKSVAKVCVIAPDRERSGSGHSLTLHRPLRIFERGPDKYAIDGTPTDCVMLGMLEVLKNNPPDYIVSGINHGPNLGDDVTYSGTVSAALEGTLIGIPSIAVSLVVSMDQTPNFTPALNFTKRILESLKKHQLPHGTLLNVNVPNVDGAQELDYEITFLGSRRFTGTTIQKIDPRGNKYYWIGGEENSLEKTEGTDTGTILRGKISVTPIKIDFTNHEFLKDFKQWKI
ncbi:MAG: 5'/3'-nucleotidase SurE [Bdellovibrionales bacterium]|nr:5'/3'-nucleotidase SurE [Bdellovibrionales bacterium]